MKSFPCLYAVLFMIAACAAELAAAGLCAQDVKSFCAEVSPGQGRLVRCLADHRDDLSPACQAALSKAGREKSRPVSGAQAKDPHFSFKYKGRERSYNVHLPQGYDQNVAYPVVVFLHGGGGSIREAYSEGLDGFSDRLGFLLAIPDGTGPLPDRVHTWNAGHCCGYAVQNRIDDVGFIAKMLEQVQARYSVDAKRVFATGISNGASMSYRLACELPDKIAAVAAVAPSRVIDGCEPSRPISVMHVHGTADPLNRFEGGINSQNPWGRLQKPVETESARSMVDFWVKKEACAADPKTVYHNAGATCVRYGPCAQGSEVEFCKLKSGGHTWPGGAQYAPADKIGAVSHDMTFEQMWDFFKRHAES